MRRSSTNPPQAAPFGAVHTPSAGWHNMGELGALITALGKDYP